MHVVHNRYIPDINVFRYFTIASLSFNTLLNNYGIKKQTVNYFTKEQEDFIRTGYKGGRTEVFKRLGSDLFYYDVNSLYPYAMTFEFPVGKFTDTDKPETIEFFRQQGFLGVVSAVVTVPKSKNITACGVRDYQGSYLFGTGTVRGVFTSVDIDLFLQEGYKVEISRGIFYNQKERLFNRFVKDFYALKSKNKGAKRDIAKLFLNSAYGKFGQRRSRRNIFFCENLNKIKTYRGDIEVLCADLNLYSYDSINYANRSINPIYAMFITSYARNYMFEVMREIGFERVYYMDTDSLVLDVKLPDRLVSESVLGLFELENTLKKAVFVCPKLYAFINSDNKTVIKMRGVPKKEYKKLSFEEIERLIKGHVLDFRFQKVSGFFEQFRMKLPDLISSRKSKKVIKDVYSKRVLLDNGIDTKPLNLGMCFNYENKP